MNKQFVHIAIISKLYILLKLGAGLMSARSTIHTYAICRTLVGAGLMLQVV